MRPTDAFRVRCILVELATCLWPDPSDGLASTEKANIMRKPIPISTFFAALLLYCAAPCAQEAGDTVIKRGTIEEDVYLAGGTVDVEARIVGDVVAAGGFVTVAEEVQGDAMLAGGTVMLRGRVHDDVRSPAVSVVSCAPPAATSSLPARSRAMPCSLARRSRSAQQR